MTKEQEFNKVPEHGWACFHCGEHFAPTFGYARGLRDAKAEETAARTERLAERWS